MSRKEAPTHKQRSSAGYPSRRTLLKATGTVGLAGLAGCLGNGSGGSTIKIGGTVPQSGPYGAFGLNEKKGIQKAVDDANANNDAGDGKKVEVQFIDTKTDPATGRKKAQELINKDVDFLVGSLSSSVALAISDLAEKHKKIYMGFAGSNKITGSRCRPYTFIASSSAVQQTSSGLGSVLKQGLGKSVYEIAADYEWGHSIQNWNENHLVPHYNGNYVGKKFVPLGTSDFSQAITEAKNSGADIIQFTEFGLDFQKSAKQADQYGLFDQAVCVWPSVDIVDAKPVGQSTLANKNFFGGTTWYYQQTNSDAGKKFANEFTKKYNEPPTSFAAAAYASVRTLLRASKQAGGTKASDVQAKLEGAKLFPQLWGVGERFRKCDHRATISSPTIQGRSPSEVNEWNMFKVVDFPSNPEKTQMRDCANTGCSL